MVFHLVLSRIRVKTTVLYETVPALDIHLYAYVLIESLRVFFKSITNVLSMDFYIDYDTLISIIVKIII